MIDGALQRIFVIFIYLCIFIYIYIYVISPHVCVCVCVYPLESYSHSSNTNANTWCAYGYDVCFFYSVVHFYISLHSFLEKQLINFNYWELCLFTFLLGSLYVGDWWPTRVQVIEIVGIYWVLNVCLTVLSPLCALSHLITRAPPCAVSFLQERVFEVRREQVICIQLKRDAELSSQVAQHRELFSWGLLVSGNFAASCNLWNSMWQDGKVLPEDSRQGAGAVTGLHICLFIDSANTCWAPLACQVLCVSCVRESVQGQHTVLSHEAPRDPGWCWDQLCKGKHGLSLVEWDSCPLWGYRIWALCCVLFHFLAH